MPALDPAEEILLQESLDDEVRPRVLLPRPASMRSVLRPGHARHASRRPCSRRRALAAGLLAFLALPGPGPASAQDPELSPLERQRLRELARAEQRFRKAEERRAEAGLHLREEYGRLETWWQEQAPQDPPETVRRWLEAEGRSEADWTRVLDGFAETPFHEFWNEHLYRHSRAARAWARAVADLEDAFLALERLRHPARFAPEAAETPEGMALIPEGRYLLRAATGYVLGHPRLQKDRERRLKGFYLDKREVSCAAYLAFLQALPESLREQHLPAAWTLDPQGLASFPEGWEERPVTGIPWTSAAAYARWAGKRLPTEDEWQAAAGGFLGRRWPLGDSFPAGGVNCRAAAAAEPRPPLEFPLDATPDGLLALTGNVREWCADLYEEPPGRGRARAVREAGASTLAVVKGGSYLDRPEECATTFRWLLPARGEGPSNVGFRCARDLR